MGEKSVTMLGYLDHDGNLRLDGRPSLAPGVVEVTIKPYTNYREGEGLMQYLQRTRAELEASGRKFRTKEEIDADIEDMRDWDSRIDEIYRQIEEERLRNNRDGGVVPSE